MTIGYSARGQCFDNTSDAIDAFYSSSQPFVGMFSTTALNPFFVFVKSSGIWKVSSTTVSSTGATTVFTAAPTAVYGSCTLQNDPVVNFQLGAELGTAVALVMVIVFCIRSIYRR